MMMVSWSAMILGLLIWAKVKSINMVSHLSTNARGRRYMKPNPITSVSMIHMHTSVESPCDSV
jgi:hypothetical protein